MFYMQDTPTKLASSALFLFREYCTILFWAQINAIRMLQDSNHPVRTFVFRRFFTDFRDFYVCKWPVRKTHLPNWYLLLCFGPWNTAGYFTKPILRQSKCYTALFIMLSTLWFLSLFHDFNNFCEHRASLCEARSPNWYLLLCFRL